MGFSRASMALASRLICPTNPGFTHCLTKASGINVVGLWKRGRFEVPRPSSVITPTTVLVLAGTAEQLAKYDQFMEHVEELTTPIIILGGGRVGQAAAEALRERGILFRIIESNPDIVEGDGEYVIGNAADLHTLVRAGIQKAPSVFITTHNDDLNIYLTIYCRRLRPDIQIISRATPGSQHQHPAHCRRQPSDVRRFFGRQHHLQSSH
jgi:Trk K+ transport system NAD-binding subunit